MESSMHDVKILQSENPRVPTDRHQTSLSNRKYLEIQTKDLPTVVAGSSASCQVC